MKLYIVITALLCAQANGAPLSILNPFSFWADATEYGLALAQQNAQFGHDALVAGLDIAQTLTDTYYTATINAVQNFEEGVNDMVNNINTALNNINDVAQEQISNLVTQSQNGYLDYLKETQEIANQIQQAIQNVISDTQTNLNDAVNDVREEAEGMFVEAQNAAQLAQAAAQEAVVNSISNIYGQLGELGNVQSVSADRVNEAIGNILPQVQSMVDSYAQLPKEDINTVHNAVTNILQGIERMAVSIGLDPTPITNAREASDNAYNALQNSISTRSLGTNGIFGAGGRLGDRVAFGGFSFSL